MRVSLEPAFVLHRRPYGDTSLLLEAFSAEHGRVGLIARGARSSKSQRKSMLQPFTPLLLSWSGGGELYTLTGVEATGPTLSLVGEPLYCALYVNELLLRLLARGDPHPSLFQPYQQALLDLASEKPLEPTLRLFEKRLLGELGYALNLTTEAASNTPVQAERRYLYVLDRGPVAFDTASEAAASGIPISGQSLLALHAERLAEPAVLREVKRLTRAALDAQLGGRVLKTRQLLLEERRRKTQAVS